MRRFVLVAAIACGGKPTPPPAPPASAAPPAANHSAAPAAAATAATTATIDEIIAVLDRFSDEMCACSDETCGEAVNQRMVGSPGTELEFAL